MSLKFLFLFNLIFVSIFFSCGFANYSSNSPEANFLEAQKDDDSSGRFKTSRRLESDDTCEDSDDCRELCESMLKNFSDVRECYEYTETEVQTFRDVYDLLATGDFDRIVKIKSADLEKFLEFGPELWEDAIYGFETQRKPDCTPEFNPVDARDREDCQYSNYYIQLGYSSGGASNVLYWIARNDWVAELLVDFDKELLIMRALVRTLADGGSLIRTIAVGYDPDNSFSSQAETMDEREDTCNLDNDDSDGYHGLFLVEDLEVEGNYDNSYRAFAANCVDDDVRKNYFLVAAEEENRYSATLGHRLLKEFCDDRDNCISFFYSHIQDCEYVTSYMDEQSIDTYNDDSHGSSGCVPVPSP